MFLVHPTLTEAEIERACESILADGEKGMAKNRLIFAISDPLLLTVFSACR